MSEMNQYPMMQRAMEELRRLPPLDPNAVRRITAAAAAVRLGVASEPRIGNRFGGKSMRLWTAIGMAAAAIVGFVVRGAISPSAERAAASSPSATPRASAQVAPVMPASSSESESKPILQQFVFSDKHAHRVAVVGDFNEWNPMSALMARSSENGPWSIIVPILPGRHIYGFMVDDSVFSLDPRMPKTRDRDLGGEGSVVIVGRP
jgi:hypothetical protein